MFGVVLSVLFCFQFSSLLAQNASFFRTDYTYDSGTRAFYKLHTNGLGWKEAVAKCREEGAELAMPTSVLEERALLDRFSKTNTNLVWIGMHDFYGEGHFLTLSGIPKSQLTVRWTVNEPNNDNNNENCVFLFKSGTINDQTCHTQYHFVCKKELQSTLEKNKNIFDKGPSLPFFREDYEYSKPFQAFYKLHTNRMTWYDAKLTCMSEGATIASPISRAEKDALMYYIKAYPALWLGIYEAQKSRKFYTLDGMSEYDIFMDWDKGEPSNSGGAEECVLLKENGFYNDLHCRYLSAFVCRKTINSLTTSNPLCETYDTEYVYSLITNRCYKYHTVAGTWHEAFKTCFDEGSYLGIINSADEARIYLQILSKTSSPQSDAGEFVHLGFNTILQSEWNTLEGESLASSGYTKWASGQPENAGADAHCGAMARLDGRLHATACSTRASFICEKSLARPLSLDAPLRYGTGDIHLCVNRP